MSGLVAPFPWFGGKRRVADLVWRRFGDVPNYVEPFAGSLAVLLARPHAPRTETVNDADCYLANFWRALREAPDAVADWCDWPVNEADLLARHRWLKAQEAFRESMRRDPAFYDAKIAGWWVWGLSAWIGSGWCPHDTHARVPDQLPHLGDAGRGDTLRPYLHALAARLRRVRVACGDWTRVMGESVTVKHGVTGVLLDPPYGSDEHDVRYSAKGQDVARDVAAWAAANGDNPLYRIALCGYDGEHAMPERWTCVAWKARGGYGSQSAGRGRENAARERIWFSPHCLADEAPTLFQAGAA